MGLLASTSSRCLIVIENLAAAFMSTSNVAPANAESDQAKKNNCPKYQGIISD
jgi:hypothetical protein